MDDTIRTTLEAWGDFYLITGTAAAALTGLQFVVQTLLATESHRNVAGGDPEGGIAAFGSPTVVHFAIALVVSSVLCAPWPGYAALRVTLGIIAVGALGYTAIVLRRTRRQRAYAPTFEDWLWHLILPVVAYTGVLVTAIEIARAPVWPLFVVAAATLLVLLVGIHNAWDTVTYMTLSILRGGHPAPATPPAPPHPPTAAPPPQRPTARQPAAAGSRRRRRR